MAVILDAILYARLHKRQGDEVKPEVLISTVLYLASKVNEVEGKVRTRDFLNVALYSLKEDTYARGVLESKAKCEDGFH